MIDLACGLTATGFIVGGSSAGWSKSLILFSNGGRTGSSPSISIATSVFTWTGAWTGCIIGCCTGWGDGAGDDITLAFGTGAFTGLITGCSTGWGDGTGEGDGIGFRIGDCAGLGTGACTCLIGKGAWGAKADGFCNCGKTDSETGAGDSTGCM